MAPTVALVTGGRGRIGRLLVDRLRAGGVRAVSLGRSPASHDDDVVVDLSDAPAVSHIIREAAPDVVVHLAAVLRGEDVLAQNERMDSAVREAIRSAGVRHTVFVSSGAVYGTVDLRARNEDSPLAPENAYGLSKVRGEGIFREIVADHADAAVTILRVFNVAGPDFPDGLMMRLLRASPSDPVTLVGPDVFVRDYIHQSDLVALLVAATDWPGAGLRVLNVGAGLAISTCDLVKRLAVPSSSYIERSGPVTASWADMTRTVRELGVIPHAGPTPDWAMPTIPLGQQTSSESVADERID
jgi:UDP-glucose 4-epimerase